MSPSEDGPSVSAGPPATLWTVEYREITPKGTVTDRFKFTEGLRFDDAMQVMRSLEKKVAWAWMEREDINFRGKAKRTNSVRVP